MTTSPDEGQLTEGFPPIETCIGINGLCSECGGQVLEPREHLTNEGRCMRTRLKELEIQERFRAGTGPKRRR